MRSDGRGPPGYRGDMKGWPCGPIMGLLGLCGGGCECGDGCDPGGP